MKKQSLKILLALTVTFNQSIVILARNEEKTYETFEDTASEEDFDDLVDDIENEYEEDSTYLEKTADKENDLDDIESDSEEDSTTIEDKYDQEFELSKKTIEQIETSFQVFSSEHSVTGI